MKRFYKMISILCIIALTVSVSVITSVAQSAEIGDTVIIKTYISNHSNMATLTACLNYDENSFDYLSSDGYNGLTTVNTDKGGEVTWASIFSVFGGKDFTEKTEVMSITLIAKRSITNVEDLISNTVIEAYDGDLVQVNNLSVSVEAEIYSDSADNQGEASSKMEFIVSRYDDIDSTSTEFSVNSSSVSVNESEEQEVIDSSSDSDYDNTKTNAMSESLESKMPEKSQITEIYSVQTADSIMESVDSDKSLGYTYLAAMAVAAAVLIIIAVFLVIVKRRTVNRDASHMR